MSFGIYIHIPFCSRRCDYCDFATWVGREDLVEEYMDSVSRQFMFQVDHFGYEKNVVVDSIFFGGGTPNLIDERYLTKLISLISSRLTISCETEITVECNPDHVTQKQMKNFATGGINRISMGVQSANQKVLSYLGREHSPDQVAIARDHIASSGIKNMSVDLIYGSAGESNQDWCDSLNFVVDLDVNHISAYALGVEPGTPLANSISSGEKTSTDDDDQATKYELAESVLNDNGFSWYEISNWAKEGQQSVHNLTYWRGGDILALGCASHGTNGGSRYSSPRNIDKYLDNLSPLRNVARLDSNYLINENRVSSITIEEEAFALKLRTRRGVHWPNKVKSESLDQFIRDGFVIFDMEKQLIYLSLKGRLMANRISVDLFEEYAKLYSSVE